jgi:hypothetical protein
LGNFISVLEKNKEMIEAKQHAEDKKSINLWDYIEPLITDEAMLSFCEEKNDLKNIVSVTEFFKTYLNKYKELGFGFKLVTLLIVKKNLEELKKIWKEN